MYRNAEATARGLMVVSASTKNNRSPRASAGIARGGDLPMIHAHHARVVLPSKVRRRVSRSVIHDNDFVRLIHDAGGLMNRLQRAPKARLLVMRGNDERNHGSPEIG